MFQMCGVFAEFERAMIQERVKAGLARVRQKGTQLGRKRLEQADPKKAARIPVMRRKGMGIRRIASEFGVGVRTVLRLLGNYALVMRGYAKEPSFWPIVVSGYGKEESMSRGFPSMTALLGLLAIAGYQNRDKIAAMLKGLGQSTPGTAGQGGLGGLLGQLGGSLSGASAGGVLSSGLGELIDRFKKNGFGDTADSWVSSGPNKQVGSSELEQAIGPEVLDTLSKQTGLSKQELLARLSRELPEAVDKYTPEGRLPTEAELSRS